MIVQEKKPDHPGIEIRKSKRVKLHRNSVLATGHLAASIGHEFNNPLGYVRSSVEFCAASLADMLQRARGEGPLSEEVDEIEGMAEALEDARSGIERLNLIVKDLQRFTSLKEVEFKSQNMDRLLRSFVQRMQHEGVALTYEPLAEGIYIDVDAVVLMLALEHLVHNAWSALERAGRTNVPGGVEMRCERFDEGGDRKLMISICDQGTGIPLDQQSKIFEPFYRYDQEGAGPGLGLTLVHQIVLAHGGDLHMWSEPGVGSQMSIVLKIPQLQVITGPVTLESTIEEEVNPRYHVLVVDENVIQAQEVATLLEKEYEVSVCSRLRDLRMMLDGGERYDYILGNMDRVSTLYRRAYDLLRSYKILRPGCVGCFVSGILSLSQRDEVRRHDLMLFRRPFQGEELIASIHKACERQPNKLLNSSR